MNKLIYNQLSEKLYIEFCKAKNQHLEKEFIKDLCLDEKIVNLFETLYKQEAGSEDGLDIYGIFKAVKQFFPIADRLKIDDNMSIAERGRLFAIQAHRDVDQQYGDDIQEAPYEIHLYAAVQYFKKYKYYIPTEDHDTVEAGTWNHDVVEDGHKTFNDLKKITNEHVAKIASAVTTNLYGHNRKARADADYYNRIKAVKYATFVKLCDRLANVSNGGGMVDGYRKEMPGFLQSLSPEAEKYPDMVAELLQLVGLKSVTVNA